MLLKFLGHSLEQHTKSWKVFVKEGDLEETFPINCSREFLEFFLELYIENALVVEY